MPCGKCLSIPIVPSEGRGWHSTIGMSRFVPQALIFLGVPHCLQARPAAQGSSPWVFPPLGRAGSTAWDPGNTNWSWILSQVLNSPTLQQSGTAGAGPRCDSRRKTMTRGPANTAAPIFSITERTVHILVSVLSVVKGHTFLTRKNSKVDGKAGKRKIKVMFY